MSNKIYFSDKGSSFSKFLVRLASGACHTIYPSGTEKQVRRLLTSPQQRVPSDIPEDINSHTFSTRYGELMTYSIGKGPTVLFVHGWSGSGSQFFDLLRSTAKQGYRAVTYDHYSHGHSGGKECNYPLFIYSLQVLANFLYNERSLFSIVSHSMGSSACLDYFKKRPIPQFLIAPLFNFYEELETRVIEAGISPALFESIINSIEDDYKISLRDHDSMRDINSISSPINIIHSISDNLARYHFSEELANRRTNITLHTVDNIGHMRIVSVPETKQALIKFIHEASTASLSTT